MLIATPTHAVDPGEVTPAVPACLQSHPDTPTELQDMLRVVREAPSTWFPATATILRTLDKVDQLVRLVQSAQLRAVSGIAVPQIGIPAASAGALPLGIARVAARQVEALAPRFEAIQAINVSMLAINTWQGIFTQTAPAVSLADLADGGHGRSDVAARAARELAIQQRLDRWKLALIQQACPEIIGAHLHAALVLSDGRRRRSDRALLVDRFFITPIFTGIAHGRAHGGAHGGFIAFRSVCAEAAICIHDPIPMAV